LVGFIYASTNACAQTETNVDQQAIKPGTCVQEIVKLQEMLHAADLTNQSLMSKNMELRKSLENISKENTQLHNTIDRINAQTGGGRIHPTKE